MPSCFSPGLQALADLRHGAFIVPGTVELSDLGSASVADPANDDVGGAVPVARRCLRRDRADCAGTSSSEAYMARAAGPSEAVRVD